MHVKIGKFMKCITVLEKLSLHHENHINNLGNETRIFFP